MKTLASVLLACCVASAATAATEQELVDQSADALRAFYEMPERQIPRRILNDAQAPHLSSAAMLTAVRIGLLGR